MAAETMCEFRWCMGGRRYAIRLFSDWTISFRSTTDDGLQFGQDHTWTERHGRWVLNAFTGNLILFFNYRGANFARRMASVSLPNGELEFVGYDYRERRITMYPLASRHTGTDHAVLDPGDVLRVLFGQFDWNRLQ